VWLNEDMSATQSTASTTVAATFTDDEILDAARQS
jgi:hypothetical protein